MVEMDAIESQWRSLSLTKEVLVQIKVDEGPSYSYKRKISRSLMVNRFWLISFKIDSLHIFQILPIVVCITSFSMFLLVHRFPIRLLLFFLLSESDRPSSTLIGTNSSPVRLRCFHCDSMASVPTIRLGGMDSNFTSISFRERCREKNTSA